MTTIDLNIYRSYNLVHIGEYMPLYEYICQDCGNRFDALRSYKDADQPISCSVCASQQTKRALSVFNAHSSGRVIAGNNQGSCAGCSGGTCSSCNHSS